MTVGEMPSHSHTANTDNANLDGTVGNLVIRAGSTASGILKLTQQTYRKGLQDGSSWESWNMSLNASHGHIIAISAAGNNQAHNNIQPYIGTIMWRRIV